MYSSVLRGGVSRPTRKDDHHESFGKLARARRISLNSALGAHGHPTCNSPMK
jgi:hypothetical protein